MVAILTAAAAAVYELFGYALYRQVDQQLLVLADAAAHSWEAADQGMTTPSDLAEDAASPATRSRPVSDGGEGDDQDRGGLDGQDYDEEDHNREDYDGDHNEDDDDDRGEDRGEDYVGDRGEDYDGEDDDDDDGDRDEERKRGWRWGAWDDEAIAPLPERPRSPVTILTEPLRLDNDGDLDLPWQALQTPDQSVEWYDRTGERWAQTGSLVLDQPLNRPVHPSGRFEQRRNLRSLTLPVYRLAGAVPLRGEIDDDLDSEDLDRLLVGYVRVSESVDGVEDLLEDLLWGLSLGWVVALGVTAIGGAWLTRQSLRPIEQSFAQLRQFTADASHELRSPLTAVRASVAVMESHPERIHPADVSKLRAIASATRQMTRLVEDLLLLARSDGTSTVLMRDRQSIPLAELLEELLDWYAIQAESRHITLHIPPLTDTAADLEIWGDGALLRRLFANLLDNALKYTPTGGQVTLTLTATESWVNVGIADTGIGIAPEHLARVFDRLWRADPARSQAETGAKGVGLGLAIAQAIARNHGGTITVTSTLGRGSRFQVSLPRGQSLNRRSAPWQRFSNPQRHASID
jgi:signal transduction histidine kinase